MKKKISIAEIQSGVLLGAPIAISVPITLNDEECEFDTHIKPFSYATVVARWRAVGQEKEALAGTIASCICDEAGKLTFTEDQVREKFSEELIEAIWQKICDVNNIGGKSKTTSSKTMKSLPNSSSTASGGTRSKRSSKTSASKNSVTGASTSGGEEASTPAGE